MPTRPRFVVAVISAALALAGLNKQLVAQTSVAADSKSLATPIANPEAQSLRGLIGKTERDGSKREPAPSPSCSFQECDASLSCFPGTNSACILQTFPDIQWRICIQASAYGDAANQHSRGIAVGPIDMRRNLASTTAWQRVIYRAEVAENATPYHEGETHLSDDQFADWTNWRRTVTAEDANGGTLITLTNDASFGPSIVAECRDRGPAWLCKGQLGSFVRRGKELVLWGIYDAGNYDYVQEFGFRDDGSISFRTGATGYVSPERPAVAHLHDSLWRIDLDLNGAGGDTAFLTRHIEPLPNDPSGLNSLDERVPFHDGVEGGEDWQPEEFNTLAIEDSASNANGRRMSYELEPLRTGTARHFATPGWGAEQWTQHDFWVTRFKPAEDTAWALIPEFVGPDSFLLPYVSDQQSIVHSDLVIWYLASAHHEPISEDLDTSNNWAVTLMHWYGFELKPHDFFDFNPLGGPPICD